MELDGSLGAAELCPVIHGQAEVDDRGIQAVELVLAAELARGSERLAAAQQGMEEVLEEGCRTVRVGLGERRARRSGAHAKVVELALHAGQSAANLPQTVGTPQLAEKHRPKLGPAVAALGRALRLVPAYRGGQSDSRKNSAQLAEEAAKGSPDGEPPGLGLKFS